jgi:hypothetical protein
MNNNNQMDNNILLNMYYLMYKDTKISKSINDQSIELSGLDAFEPQIVKDQMKKYKNYHSIEKC